MRRARDAVYRFLDAFCPPARRHIAEAPDTAHGTRLQPQWNRIALDDPAVLEIQDIKAVRLRIIVPFVNPVHEEFRVHELRRDALDDLPTAGDVIVGGDEIARQTPDFLEPAGIGNN